jgi:hypothetical protein
VQTPSLAWCIDHAMEELAALVARNDATRAATKSREDASSQGEDSGDASGDSEWACIIYIASQLALLAAAPGQHG